MTTTNTAATERARLAAILNLPGAKVFAQLAGHLAVETNMAPEKVEGVLEAAAGRGRFAHLNTSPAARSGLGDRMAAKPMAALGTSVEGNGPDRNTPAGNAAFILAAAGRKPA